MFSNEEIGHKKYWNIGKIRNHHQHMAETLQGGSYWLQIMLQHYSLVGFGRSG